MLWNFLMDSCRLGNAPFAAQEVLDCQAMYGEGGLAALSPRRLEVLGARGPVRGR